MTGPLIFRCLADDETTVLLDLAELNAGGVAGFGIRDGSFDLGGDELSDAYLEDMAYDGAVQIASSHPRTMVTLDLYLFGLDPDDVRGRIRLLGQLLDRPHVWEFRPENGSQSVLIDAFRSPAPKLGGQTSHGFLVHNYYLGTPTMLIRRQPGLRVRTQASIVEAVLTNAPGGNFLKVYNPGSMRSPVRFYVEPLDSSTRLAGVQVGRSSVGDIDERGADFLGRSIATATFPTGSETSGGTAHPDSNASNGYVALTTFGSTVLLSRWAATLTPVDPTALDGAHRVKVAGYAAPGAVYTLQIRAGMVPPLAQLGDLITLDLTNPALTSAVRFEIDMGLVAYDRFGASLVLECWAACDTVAKTINWDAFKLIPASEAIVAAREPSYLGQGQNTTEWDPATLVVCAHIDKTNTSAVDDGPANSRDGDGLLDISDDGRVRIGAAPKVGSGDLPNTTNEGIGTPPNAGFPLPIGNYTATVDATVVNNEKLHGKHAELRARNLSDPVVATRDRAKAILYSEKGVTEVANQWTIRWPVSVSTDLWQIQVVYTHDREPLVGSPVQHKVWVDGLSMGAIRAIAGPEQAVLDGITESSYGWLSEGKTHALTPAVPEAEAGWNLYAFDFEELNVGGVEAALPGRGPLPSFWALREYRVVVDLSPRHSPE